MARAQWPACTRYAPRATTGSVYGAASNGFGVGANILRQIPSGQRIDSNHTMSTARFSCSTGATPCMKYAYSAFMSSSVRRA